MLSPLAAAHEKLKSAEAMFAQVNAHAMSLHLADAQRRWQQLRRVDLSAPLSRLPLFARRHTVEAYRLRLAEAWKQAQHSLYHFQDQLRGPQAGPAGEGFSVEAFKAELLTRYCAHVLHYQAELGKHGRRQIPAEWMQWAAAAALVSVIQAALVLWVLHQPRRRRAHARRAVTPQRLLPAVFLRPTVVPLSLPLLC